MSGRYTTPPDSIVARLIGLLRYYTVGRYHLQGSFLPGNGTAIALSSGPDVRAKRKE